MAVNIYKKLAEIQADINVPKSQYNKHGKYYYRSAEDILESLKPYEEKHKVAFMVTEELKHVETMNDETILFIESTAVMHDTDSDAVVTAKAAAIVELQAKGMHMPQRTGSASSYAKKYALGNLLLLDDTKDPDATNEHGKKPASKAPATPAKKPGKPTAKAMSEAEKTSFLKGIGEGKFALVEKHLTKYADDDNKKAVVEALTNAKSGK